MKFSLILSLSLALLCDHVGLAGKGEPDEYEITARIDEKSIVQIGDTLPGLEGPLPYKDVFAPEAPNVEGLVELSAQEVVVTFVDVQNDFTDYHGINKPKDYEPSLAVPGSKPAIKVMNAIRLAGNFSDNGGPIENRFCVIYRSEDYHLLESYTFADSRCWLYSNESRFRVRKEGSKECSMIKECTRYKFNLVSDHVDTTIQDQVQSPWTSPRDIYVWPVHCVVGTYGQQAHDDLSTDKNDRVVLKAVYKYQESLTAVVESYVSEQTIEELPNDFNNKESSIRKLINMKLDLENFANAKVILVTGFEYMNCVGATLKSLASIVGNDGVTKKYRVIVVTDAVGYFAPPKNEARKAVTAELKALGVEFVHSTSLVIKFGEQSNTVKTQ